MRIKTPVEFRSENHNQSYQTLPSQELNQTSHTQMAYLAFSSARFNITGLCPTYFPFISLNALR